MGTRLDQTIVVSSVSITGADAELFALNQRDRMEFGKNSCEKLKISFSTPSTLVSTPIDAVLVLTWDEINSAGTVYASSATIQLQIKDYDFESQKLGYPPPPTMAPTISPAPTQTLSTSAPTTGLPNGSVVGDIENDSNDTTTNEMTDDGSDEEQQPSTAPLLSGGTEGDCLEGCSGLTRMSDHALLGVLPLLVAIALFHLLS
jgi:hypothetical protein